MFILLYLNEDGSIDETWVPEFVVNEEELKSMIDYYVNDGKDEEDTWFDREKFRYIKFGSEDLKKI